MEDTPEGRHPTLSRRKLLGLALATAGGVAVGAKAHRESTTSPETDRHTPVDYGFTQHVYVKEDADTNQTPELFKRCIDLLAERGQKVIRTNVWDHELCTASEDGTMVWSAENIKKYRELFSYAMERGLKLCLVSNVPTTFRHLPHEAYLEATRQFYSHIPSQFGDLVSSWQVFNEADIHFYRSYDIVPQDFHRTEEWKAYMRDFTEVVKTATESIRTTSPEAQIGINMAASWHGNREHRVAREFFDPLAPYINELLLSYYPYGDKRAIRELPHSIEDYKRRYPDKKIIIGEIGASMGVVDSAATQLAMITAALDSIRGGKVQPDGVYMFSLTDRYGESRPIEKYFGLLDAEGSDKGAFEGVVQMMKDEEEVTE